MINEDGGTGASGAGHYTTGTTVTLTAGAKSGRYSFSSWSLTGATVISTSGNSVTFTIPANAVAAKINWTYIGGSSSGGSNKVVTPPVQDKPNIPTQAEIKVDGKVDENGNATASLSAALAQTT